MKKITSLLALFLVVLGINAQDVKKVVGLTALPTEKTLPANLKTGYYLIKEVNPGATGKPGGWLKMASEAADALVTPQGKDNTIAEAELPSCANYIWYIEMGEGSLSIATANKVAAWQTPEKGLKKLVAYAQKAALKCTTESVTLGNHTATPVDGSCIIQDAGATACFHYTNNDLGSWTDANPASVCMFEFYNVDASLVQQDLIEVTYNYMFNGENVLTLKKCQDPESAYDAPTVPFVSLKYENSDKISASNNVVNVLCQENLPFRKSESFEKANWNYIETHHSMGGFYWYYDVAQDGKIATKSKADPFDYNALTNDPAYAWCFVGDVFKGFKIYNKAAGKDMAVQAKADNPVLVPVADATLLKLAASTVADVKGGFCVSDKENSYFNRQAGPNLIGYYHLPDNGSTCVAKMYGDFLLGEVNTELSVRGAVGTNAYYANPANSKKLDDALAALYADMNSVEAGKTIKAIIEEAKAVTELIPFDATKYYRLENVKHHGYLDVDASNKLIPTTKNASNVNSLWKITKGEGEAVTLQHVNSNLFVNGYDKVAETEGGFQMKNMPNTTAEFGIYKVDASKPEGQKEQYICQNLNRGIIPWYEPSKGSDHGWYLFPVSSVEVNLTAGWASLYLPFGVKMAEGLTAYTGEIDASQKYLMLTAVQGDLPKNSAVILNGSADKYTLVIDEAATGTLASGNALVGTNVQIAKVANSLVLGNGAQGIGMYLPKGDSMKANKAYVAPKTAVNSLAFAFGEATGVENVEVVVPQNAVYYDLSGRRVANPVKGVYILNGKKVYVK